MRTQLHISVPQPCSQRWSDMQHVDDNKRHCASCEKVITDFTQMSDEQLIAHFKNNPSSCGMFAPHQLNRQLKAPKKKQSGWLKALVVPALLAMTEADAQDVKPVATSEQTADSAKPRITVPLDDVFHTLKDTLIVSGKVLETDDSLQEHVMPGTELCFHLNGNAAIGCTARADGTFQVKLPHCNVGDTVRVEISSSGKPSCFISLVLKEPENTIVYRRQESKEIVHVMGGAVATVTAPASPRSWSLASVWWWLDPRSW